MLIGIAVLLLVLWALGFGFAGLGNIIHVLLVIAVCVIAYQFITGRRVE